jgi:hypothetical protein
VLYTDDSEVRIGGEKGRLKKGVEILHNSYARDSERISICMRVSDGARKINRQGGAGRSESATCRPSQHEQKMS